MNNWISVKDRLPENDTWLPYVVVCKNRSLRTFQICWYNHYDKKWHLQDDLTGKVKINVMYYMPLLKDHEISA